MWDGHSMRLLFVGEPAIAQLATRTSTYTRIHAGPDAGKELTSLAVLNESVFASAGDSVLRYVRGREIGRFVTRTAAQGDSDSESDADSSDSDSESDSSDSSDSDDQGREELGNLLLFGNTLMALSTSGRRMYVWDIPPYVKPASQDPNSGEAMDDGSATDDDDVENDSEVTPYATLEFPTGFTATKLVHPASYLNKVVAGSKEGELAVWNIRTG